MIQHCALCTSQLSHTIFKQSVPIYTFLDKGDSVKSEDFLMLEIVECDACGHVYNRAFDSKILNKLYGNAPLPCMPVHPSMHSRHSNLLNWIGTRAFHRKHVLEIGGGSGHFARLLSSFANHIDVYEPNPLLTKSLMPESNINIYTQSFPAPDSPVESYDFVVSRQVLEHIPEVDDTLRAIGQALKFGGLAYIEVPSLSYIINNNAYFDLHFEHVHYFSPDSIIYLASQFGLKARNTLEIMGGHDFGILFEKTGESIKKNYCHHKIDYSGLERTFSSANSLIAQFQGNIALYGATTQTQLFLNSLHERHGITAVIDDSEERENYCLYDKQGLLPVFNSSKIDLTTFGTIIVGAYLHSTIIAERLRERDYHGTIRTIGPRLPNVDSLF